MFRADALRGLGTLLTRSKKRRGKRKCVCRGVWSEEEGRPWSVEGEVTGGLAGRRRWKSIENAAAKQKGRDVAAPQPQDAIPSHHRMESITARGPCGQPRLASVLLDRVLVWPCRSSLFARACARVMHRPALRRMPSAW